MFYVARFAVAWIVWLAFADKNRWREMLPVCVFATALGLATDILVFHYPLWEYIGPPALCHLADDLAIYPVVVYLFIQRLPKGQALRDMFAYWLFWTTFAITIELIFVHTGHMRYPLWWNTWHSYAADWFLYWLFFKFHQILRLEQMSAND